VVIRGLDIFGVNPPTNGVRFIGQGSLHIEDCVIRRFNSANSFGVSAQPSGTGAKLFITNSTITQNGNGATGGGILIQATGTGTVNAVLKNVNVFNNNNEALHIDAQANTASFQQVAIENSDFAGSTNGVNAIGGAGGINLIVTFTGSRAQNNSGTGLLGSGHVVFLVGDSSITGNSTGVSSSGLANIDSYGDNHVNGNNIDGAFTPPVLGHK
jgi:hypothetical protein